MIRRSLLILLLVVAFAGATGCASGKSEQLPGAAEPAMAPVPTRKAIGSVTALPGLSFPEGIAVDHKTGLVVVALRDPDRLAYLNERTMRLLRVTAVQGRARHLSLAAPGGPLLLAAEDTNRLLRIALPSGKLLTSTVVGKQPHDAEPVGDEVWVAVEFGGSAAIVRDGAVVGVVHGPVQPGGIAAAGGSVGVVDVRGAKLYVYDARTRAPRGTVRVGAGPSHAAPIGADDVLVTDTRGSAVLLVDLVRRHVLDRLALPGSAYGIASDPATGQAWVSLVGRNQVVHLAVRDGRLRELARLPTVRQPNTVALDRVTRCVFIAGSAASAVQRICPQDMP